MPAKPVFNDEQLEVILEAARRVFKKDFAWMKKTAEHPAAQEAFGLAIGVSQQSASALLKGKYRPGVRVASNIANLEGKTLKQLIGDFDEPDVPPQGPTVASAVPGSGHAFANLDVCLQFYASSKQWSPWTVAAARAGYFGNVDIPAPAWASKLDMLEKVLDKARKVA